MARFWNFRNDENEPEDGVLDVRGVLVADDGWFMDDAVSAREFREALKNYRNVTVILNSPGGDVMAGAEMYSALREHSTSGRGKVTVKVTALAASAASVLAMAGDEVLMSPVAYMMVHNPWSIVAGNADEMRHEADVLDEIAEGIITAYQLKTGKSRAKLKELMEGESYMDARRCVKEGFADGLLYQGDATGDDPEEPDEPDTDDPEEDPEEEDGVMMRARDFGMGRAVALAQAHHMKLDPLRTVKFTDTASSIEETLEEKIRQDIIRRADMLASLF
ncbi:MAG: Clp protease ClpP [Bacteroidales bacterium]|nr:Clp protease ClpP [Bacteroidales bacterium]